MRDIRIAAAQFEHRNGEKQYNLGVMHDLARKAAEAGAEVVSFHEACIPAYTHLRRLDRAQLAALAEPVPDGPSVRQMMEISQACGAAVGAGLIEADAGRFYNTYVVVDGDRFVARHRKLHPFVNPHLAAGDQYTVFELRGCTFGILICYDNNLPENVRITALMGAEVLLMPHVTCCLPSPMPGRGVVARALWEQRERDPVRLRQEFLGPKGREWLLRWIPARAWENGIYAVFTNPVGIDDDQVRNGNAMLLDPFGEVLAECNTLGDDVVVGLCTAEKIPLASGRRYLRARRPELYGRLVEPPAEPPVTQPGWDPTL